jgi:hypothetical protein
MNYDSKGLLEYILSNPHTHEWSVQGLGMLRLYLNKRDRLSIWHNGLRKEGATPIHDHYWSFRSWILAGELRNTRYRQSQKPWGEDYWRYRIQTGEKPEKQILEGPLPDVLRSHPTEIYHAGDSYHQHAIEAHQTEFQDGTVTLIRRLEYLPKTDEAYVWGPVGYEFNSAEPRPATSGEIELAVNAVRKHLTT